MTGGLVGGRKESDAEVKEGSTSHGESSASAGRSGLARMGTWGWGGKAAGSSERPEDDPEHDDHRIRFTIGGAGRRLTKDDFLREIQGLDPKARAEIVDNSNASPALKAIAKNPSREPSPHTGGSGRGLYPPKPKVVAKPQAPDLDETEEETDSEHERVRRKSVQAALQLSRKKDAPISSNAGRSAGKVSSYDDDEPETAAEKKRRVQAMKGVEDDDEPESSSSGSRGRTSRPRSVDEGDYPETPAEKRRREAALGLGRQRDGSDDVGPSEITVPEPAVRPLRGIRFAESPVRGEGKK